MIVTLLAKFALRSKTAARIKAAIKSAEAEGEKVINELRADIARLIQEAKAKL